MTELADKIEAAEGPSRELDASILIATRYPTWAIQTAAPKGFPESLKPGRIAEPVTNSWIEAPRYTASLDAAMTLVPEGRSYILHSADSRYHDHEQGARPSAIVFSKSWSRHEANAATPALALCAAALRAGDTDAG